MLSAKPFTTVSQHMLFMAISPPRQAGAAALNARGIRTSRVGVARLDGLEPVGPGRGLADPSGTKNARTFVTEGYILLPPGTEPDHELQRFPFIREAARAAKERDHGFA